MQSSLTFAAQPSWLAQANFGSLLCGRHHRHFALAFCLILVPSRADAPLRPWQPVVDLDLIGTYNPVGIQVNAACSLRKAWNGIDGEPRAYIQSGGLVALNPAYACTGLFLEVQPAPFLVLRAEGDAFRFFGHWGSLLSFGSSTEPYGEEVIERRKGQEEAANGRRLVLQGTPQGRIGSVVLRHQATLGWWRFGGRGPWFYELENEVLLRDGDRTQDHQTFVNWESSWSFGKSYVGPTYQITRARDAGLYRRRIGLSLAFEASGAKGRWGRMRGGLILGRNQEDRNRRGELYFLGSFGTTWMR